MRIQRARLISELWAIEPIYLAGLFAEYFARGVNSPEGEELAGERKVEARTVEARIGNIPGASRTTVGVVPIHGVLDPDPWWGTPPAAIRKELDQLAASDEIGAIVLDVDSPGGNVHGIAELAGRVREVAAAKPVLASTSGTMASAAYWIGSQAGGVVASRGATVGSVGVYTVHQNVAKLLESAGVEISLVSAGAHKTEGNPFEPLGEEAREHVQEQIDHVYGLFVEDVAAGRERSRARVEADFGQGRVYHGEEARRRGMVDSVTDGGTDPLDHAIGAASMFAAGSVDPGDLDRRLRSLDLQKQKAFL